MSTPAHILSGAYIGVVSAHVLPTETIYILIAVVSAGIIDTDHIYFIVRDWKYYRKNGFIGKLHKARSVFHELVGLTIIGIIVFLLSFIHLKLALVVGIPAMIHIIEDMIMGKSTPFKPFGMSEMQLIPQNMKLKIVVDVIIIIIFSLLWIQYLRVV